MRLANIDVVDPRGAAILADLDVHVAFERLARRDRLVVDVAVVRGAVRIERDRRIGAIGLRHRTGDGELVPGQAAVIAGGAALAAIALVDRQPRGTICRNVYMSMQPA